MIGGLTAGFFGSGIKIVPSGMMWYYGVVLDGDAMAIEINLTSDKNIFYIVCQ
jgi:hypothetical protein